MLTWILKKQEGKAWIGSVWLMIGTIGGCCEGGNESSGSIKCGKFLDQLRNCRCAIDSASSVLNCEHNFVTP